MNRNIYAQTKPIPQAKICEACGPDRESVSERLKVNCAPSKNEKISRVNVVNIKYNASERLRMKQMKICVAALKRSNQIFFQTILPPDILISLDIFSSCWTLVWLNSLFLSQMTSGWVSTRREIPFITLTAAFGSNCFHNKSSGNGTNNRPW